MGKRKHQEKDEERILKKIKRLEKKIRRRRHVIMSDDSDVEPENEVLPDVSPLCSPQEDTPQNQPELNLDMPSQAPPLPEALPDPGPSIATQPNNQIDINQVEEAQLEDDILAILGEAPQPDVALGQNIHKDIASRWQDILSKGLPRETKEALLKKYLIPANCNLLVAPTLNPEAKAAVSETLVKRDTTLMQKQTQIGIALSALSQLTEMIIHNESSKQTLLQPLSDACRLLCDSHNIETKTRRSIIMSSLNIGLRDALSNSNRDNYLFGVDLGEKLKAAKSVQKTGESLTSKPNQTASSSKNLTYKNNAKNRSLNYRGFIPKKPPFRSSESSRGRGTARQTRAPNQRRAPRPAKASPSPSRKHRR